MVRTCASVSQRIPPIVSGKSWVRAGCVKAHMPATRSAADTPRVREMAISGSSLHRPKLDLGFSHDQRRLAACYQSVTALDVMGGRRPEVPQSNPTGLNAISRM